MLINDKPAIHPNMCAKCLCTEDSPGREWFLDTGIDTSYDGRVYLCCLCVADAVKSSPGMYTWDEVNDIVSKQQETVARANELINLYENRIQVLSEAGFDLSKILNFIERNDERLRELQHDGESDSNESEPDAVIAEPTDVEQQFTGTIEELDSTESNSDPFLTGFNIS